MIFVGLLVAAFVTGLALGVWRSRPPRGYDLIVLPKTTHLIFEAEGVRIRHYNRSATWFTESDAQKEGTK